MWEKESESEKERKKERKSVNKLRIEFLRGQGFSTYWAIMFEISNDRYDAIIRRRFVDATPHSNDVTHLTYGHFKR